MPPRSPVEVYWTANAVDAQLVKNLLAENGIEADVVGAKLQFGMGELPAAQVFAPRLWVAESDALRARAIIAESESRRRQPRPVSHEQEWTCPHCGETVEATFDMCWNCQQPQIP
jgi:hypothetical protein